MTDVDKRKAPEPEQAGESSNAAPEGAVTWQPEGSAEQLRWTKKQKRDDTMQFAASSTKRVITDKVKKKMMDKEIPFSQIPPKNLPLYIKAEEAEWEEWQKQGSVRVCSLQESKEVNREVEPARIIGLRFVYRDKNASVRTPQVDLPVKAKARLCAQAWNEPLAKAGLIKVDAPTVQRVGVMIFFQVTVQFGWIKHWRKGDV